MTRVRLAAAEERARAAERAADELRRMGGMGKTTTTATSSTIIRGLSDVVVTGAAAGEGEGDGDTDTPMSDQHGLGFFTPAASTDPTPSATPKGGFEPSTFGFGADDPNQPVNPSTSSSFDDLTNP